MSLAVRLDPKLLARVESACIRLVLEGVKGDEGTVRVNGAVVPLPARDWITDGSIEPKLLKPDTSLVFETSGHGYQVDIASLILEWPPD